MKLRFFKGGYDNINEIKKEYKKLCKVYHPDAGGSHNAFIELKKEFDYLLNNFFKENNISELLQNKINEISNIFDIDIEIIGNWLWVGGNTLPIKDILKNAGFLWSVGKKKWFFTEKLKKKNRKYGRYNYTQIKDIFGSETIKVSQDKKYLK